MLQIKNGNKDWSKYLEGLVNGQEEPDSFEPLSGQSDAKILNQLSEYLGAFTNSGTINHCGIEDAQRKTEEEAKTKGLSEEELAELDDTCITAAARAAQEKARYAKLMRERNQETDKAMERLEAHQAKWDSEMHEYGGEQLSGSEINKRINWFSKKENQEKVRNELIKNGKTRNEADEIIDKMRERDELMKRQRNSTTPLTPAEQMRLDELNKDEQVIDGSNVGKNLFETQNKYENNGKLEVKNALIDKAYSDAYETFPSAPNLKTAFTAATQAYDANATTQPKPEALIEKQPINTAKVQATINQFM